MESIEPQPEVVDMWLQNTLAEWAKIEKRLLVLIYLEKALSLELTENILREG